MVKKHIAMVGTLLLAGGMLFGCARKAAPGNRVFATATPELQAIWDNAVAADQTNGYVAAVTGYHDLLAQKASLTDDQIAAVHAAALAINQRLYAAASSGDAAAKEASLKLATMQNQR